MKVLLVNRFFFIKGGARTVYFRERDILEQTGVQVIDFSMQHGNNFPSGYTDCFVSNMDYHKASNLLDDIKTTVNFIHNSQACEKILTLLEKKRPDIVHFHNIYHQLTSALIKVAYDFSYKTMLTAHDYKITCPAYSMLHDGKVCDSYIIGTIFNALRYRCQEGPASKNLLLFLKAAWQYIAQNYQILGVIVSPSVFLCGVLLRTLPNSRIDAIVNGVDDSRPLAEVDDEGYMLYFGRLSREEGVVTLLAAHKKMRNNAPLKVVGHGPLHDGLAAKYPDVEFLGYMQQGEVLDKLIKHARAVILPSEYYENCSMAMLETISLDKPVIGSCIDDMPEQVRDGVERALFEPGSMHESVNAMDILANSPEKAGSMGLQGRARLSEKYALSKRMDTLRALYKELLSRPQYE